MDSNDHDKATDILKSLGMDTSTAIRVFFKMVEQEKGLPFDVKLQNPEITSQIAEDIKASEEEYKHGNYKSYDNVEELLKDLKN